MPWICEQKPSLMIKAGRPKIEEAAAVDADALQKMPPLVSSTVAVREALDEHRTRTYI